MAIEGQYPGERFPVGMAAIPSVAERILKDLDYLGHQEPGGHHRVRQDVDIGAGAGYVIGAARVRVRVYIERKVRRSQAAKPLLDGRIVIFRRLEHRLGGCVPSRG